MNAMFSLIELGNDSFGIDIDPSLLALTREQIVSEIGYADNQVPEFFSEQIDEIMNKIPELCNIRAGFRILDVTSCHIDGFDVNGRLFSLQKKITNQLRKSEKVVLFICTIGSQMENWSSALFAEGDAVKAHFVDTIASAAAERATDILHGYIGKRMLEHGLFVTNRFSPGYCGWSVSEQHLLFSFFSDGFCGIELTESALMMPKKSTSGIIGVGPSVKFEPYLCNRCLRNDCTYRKYLQAKQARPILTKLAKRTKI